MNPSLPTCLENSHLIPSLLFSSTWQIFRLHLQTHSACTVSEGRQTLPTRPLSNTLPHRPMLGGLLVIYTPLPTLMAIQLLSRARDKSLC